MIFNSLKFWIFFLIVLVAYYGLFRKSSRLQNITLLLASYVFYGMVDWKMCALLLSATIVFYGLGTAIARQNMRNEKAASRLTLLGVLCGIGMLFYFKYLDFFTAQFGALLSAVGLQNNMQSFGIIMPLGISFFTFKLISYLIEVHREKIEPSADPIAFGTYIAFFPTIMSGPIDMPGKILPQLQTARKASYSSFADGAKRIVWGMFLKMCIADQIAGFTGAVFGNYAHHNASSILMAAGLYYFQMYADFAGYSDMAIGVSQILGIRITENFNRPIFAQNISEYWRRWHISLTSWLTQYVYMPLNIAFRNAGTTGICLAAVINTLAIGAWHGANWTYILFGLYHGIIIAIIILVEKRRKKLEKKFQLTKKPWWKYSRMLLTFVLVDFAMVLFQAGSVGEFVGILSSLKHGFGQPFYDSTLYLVAVSLLLLLFKEWKDENKRQISFLHSKNDAVAIVSMAALLTMILLFGNLSGESFIYFQF